MDTEKKRLFQERYQSALQENNTEEASIVLIEYILAGKQHLNPQLGWEGLFWYYQYYPIMALYRKMITSLNGLNPGMGGISGFFEISKTEIATHLNPHYYPKTLLVKPKQPIREVLYLMDSVGLTFDGGLICKPDMGERSYGVEWIHDVEELNRYAAKIKRPFLIQQKLSQHREFTLSFFRDEESNEFCVEALMERNFPFAEGFGKTTLYDLIVKKPLSEIQQESILSLLSQDQLDRVLACGEVFPLGGLGSMSYGTTLTRRVLLSSEKTSLNSWVKQVLTDTKGDVYDIWFGRFDIRANSVEDLLAGRAMIIELNGAMAMPLEGCSPHMDIYLRYDLFKKQYKRMYQIAQRNIDTGRGKKNSQLLFLWSSLKKLRSNPAQWKGALEARRTIRRAKRALKKPL